MVKNNRGFTLIEISFVMAIIAILYFVALPNYSGTVDRAREAALAEDLQVMRKAIFDFYQHTGDYPQELRQLVTEKYLYAIPVDPIGREKEWGVTRNERGKISDVHSLSDKIGADGRIYSLW
jgi:general secretion pathway protein G